MNRREGGEAIHSFGSEDTVQWLIRIEMFPKFLGRNIFLILLNNLSLSKAVGEYFWTYASCELFLKGEEGFGELFGDRKSTRLNSSHLGISYAVFCLKKKKKRV